MKAFKLGHFYREKVLCLGAFKTKKEFLNAYMVACGIDWPAEDRETKKEYGEQTADLEPLNSSDDIQLNLALMNEGQILFIPSEVFSLGYWQKEIENCHRLKFIDVKVLERLNDMQKELDDAERYRKLKSKLLQLAEHLQADEVDYLV